MLPAVANFCPGEGKNLPHEFSKGMLKVDRATFIGRGTQGRGRRGLGTVFCKAACLQH